MTAGTALRGAPVLITGGAGFIGSALVRALVRDGQPVVTIDKLTYSGNLSNLDPVRDSPLHHFERIDVCDRAALDAVFVRWQPAAVYHLAAESHVDRSIEGPLAFVETNVVGTAVLLQCALDYWRSLSDPAARSAFRLLVVSTDEVFGDLGPDGHFTAASPYRPRSPYAASKAAADHLARSWHTTYGLPTLVSNCGNNYGPYQFPEKLIPLAVLNGLEGRRIPVYGDGRQVRDWIHVDDHVAAIRCIMERGKPGESYLVGARQQLPNIEVVRAICAKLNERRPASLVTPFADMVEFVTDRPGHDTRYAIDPAKVESELGWQPAVPFMDGLAATIEWYAGNTAWCAAATSTYNRSRLGLLD